MLAQSLTIVEQQSFDQVAIQTGIHPDILRMLVRDGILDGVMHSWKDQTGICDLEQAREIADQLAAARAPVEGMGITIDEAIAKYGFPNATIYRWHKAGWIHSVGVAEKYNAKLFNEGDIAFARALADMRGQAAGKAVFPAKPRSGRPRKK